MNQEFNWFSKNLTFLVEKNGGVAAISDKAMISRQMLNRYMIGEAEPRLQVLLRLVDALGTDVSSLCQQNPDFLLTPQLTPLPYLDDKFIPEYKITAHRQFAKQVVGKCALCSDILLNQLHVTVDSLRILLIDSNAMDPLLHCGDLIIVTLLSDNIVGSDSVYLLHNDKDLIVRRIQNISSNVSLAMADNKNYDSFTFNPGHDFEIIAKVLMVGLRTV